MVHLSFSFTGRFNGSVPNRKKQLFADRAEGPRRLEACAGVHAAANRQVKVNTELQPSTKKQQQSQVW